MLDKIKNGDLVICNNQIKKILLKEINRKKQLLNIKFMTLGEFCNNYFGTYKLSALYHLMKEYKLNYDVALEYLENVLFDVDELKVYYNYLVKNDLIVKNEMFKNTLNSIVVIGYDVDPYIKKELSKYNTEYIYHEKGDLKPVVYCFDKQTDEIAYVASDIVSKLGNVGINDVCLLSITDDYKNEVKRIFDLFNLQVNIENSRKIYGTKSVSRFLTILKKSKDINKALDSIKQNDVYNKIVYILNKYSFVLEVDYTFIEIITNELKKASIKNDEFKNAINIVSFDEIEDEKYYYLLGFNQDNYPRIYKDDEFIKDELRKKKGLFTSLEKFKNSKNKIINTISNCPNITISYCLKDNYNSYYPSSLIEELGLDVIMNEKVLPIYSNSYNRQRLGLLLDRFYKFNEVSDELAVLFNNYDIPYRTYNNEYTGLEFEKLKEYLNGKINLSYSSMNDYFLCAFRFYVCNILKLDPFEESFMTMVGSLFHLCLSHMYDTDFDLKKIYEKYLADKELSNKEKFFVNKLYKELEFVIDTIKMQEEYSSFDKVMCEQKITVDKSSLLKINFVGIVDKIKCLEKNGKTLVAIIDYKTGYVETRLDNINYGLHLQLPVYIYLTKEGLHKDVQIVGFYLQKILNSTDIDIDDADALARKKLKLDGYSINDENLISLFDSSYDKSEVIKGMSLTKSGFSSYTKLFDSDGACKITDLVDSKIDEVVSSLEDASFPINPKRIDNKLVGCEFCSFKDLCFRKEEDIVNLKNVKFEDIICE